MAKKKQSASAVPPDGREPASQLQSTDGGSPAITTAELVADGANPRKISDEGAAGLRKSIERFGDLAGIVFNRRTGELVTGHQRMEQIRAAYGDREIETVDAESGVGAIRIDAEHYFPVRLVDWTPAKQRAANVAANNAKIQGSFTKDLSTYLLAVEAELSAEMPGICDDVLLTQLMAAGIDTSDATGDGSADNQAVPELHQVIVDCTDQAHQQELYERLKGEGLNVKLLTV